MKNKIFYGSIIAAVLVIIAAVVIKLYGPYGNQQVINLPTPAATNASDAIGSKSRLDVTPDTVQVVLKTIARTENFTRTYTVKSFWSGGESDSTLKMWQKSDKIKMTVSQNNTVKNFLVRGSDLYIWYDGIPGIFKSKLSSDSESSEIDKFSRLIRYEDLFDVPVADISDASFSEKPGQPCIYVKYKSGDLGYVKQIYVSIDTGLLVSCEIDDGDTPIYKMESDSTPSTPSDEVFNIPT